MAAAPLVDLAGLDKGRMVVTREEIYRTLPHRFEFMQLDGIVHVDIASATAVALRRVREDEFWVRGHIPGRPILPGVLMIETAAQLAAYMAHKLIPNGPEFWGFGGVDAVKFRAAVTPPSTMYFALKGEEYRPRRCIADVQAWVGEKLVFESRITGMPV